MLLANIVPTLDEVLQVKGCPLEEVQIWALLRKLICVIINADQSKWHQNLEKMLISTKSIKLYPNGRLELLEEDSSTSRIHIDLSQHNPSLLQKVALLLLQCAAYNLDEMCPLNISSTLQTLLTSMCEQGSICTLDHVQEICNHQHNSKPTNDSEIISNLSSIVLGSIDLSLIKESKSAVAMRSDVLDASALSSIFEESLSLSDSSITSVSSKLSSYGRDAKLNNKKDLTVHVTSDMESEKIKSRNVAHRQKGLAKPFICTDLPNSVLKIGEKVPTLHVDLQSSENQMIAFYVQFVNHCKVEIVTKNPESTRIMDILQSALTVFLSCESTIEIDQLMFFSLAVWRDSEYYFFENTMTLDRVFAEFPMQNTFHIRVVRFAFDTSSLSSIVQSAIYIQIRADVVDERMQTTPDEALSLAALALQCEMGDYKAEYGCDYFTLDEFVPSGLVSRLGIPLIQTELVSMHRQLAGVGEKDSKLLYLRKSQKLEDYGVNFFKVFKQKSCKEKAVTWVSVGPRGIGSFDIGENCVRIKRHNFLWSDLKKISFKNRKIALTRLSPEVKLKFYQEDMPRARYVTTLIGKLHSYYSSLKESNEVTALSLFDDITGLSSNLSKDPFSPPTKHSTPIVSGRRKSELKPTTSWTYNTPQFRRNSKVIRKHSSSLSSSTSKSNPSEKSRAGFVGTTKKQDSSSSKSASSGMSTKALVMEEMRQVLDDERLQPNFSSPSQYQTAPFDEMKYRENKQDPNTSAPTPAARTKHKAKAALKKKISADQALNNTLSSACVTDDDIHETARSFYNSSLGGSRAVPPSVGQLNSTLLKVVETDKN